uniref:Uncharacterized protein n=1 Tax=Mycena chlorophos TaxID=658473 RepID=A0ABQ0LCP5_MYCCL|nr:predicted protein [Mycena chlorophos]
MTSRLQHRFAWAGIGRKGVSEERDFPSCFRVGNSQPTTDIGPRLQYPLHAEKKNYANHEDCEDHDPHRNLAELSLSRSKLQVRVVLRTSEYKNCAHLVRQRPHSHWRLIAAAQPNGQQLSLAGQCGFADDPSTSSRFYPFLWTALLDGKLHIRARANSLKHASDCCGSKPGGHHSLLFPFLDSALHPPTSMYPFTGEAGAALAFLIGYLAVFVWMLFGFFTHRIKWRSRYSALLFHVTIRLASQGSGIGFGILGFRNTGLFVAFLVLGAEGYFSLVLCAFRFLISWHQHNLPSGESWLEPRDPPNTNKKRKVLIFAFLGPLAFLFYHDNPMVFFHSALILANVAIIVGGSYLAGADYSEPNSPDTLNRIRVSKITRTAGQAVFLVGNALLLIFILVSMRNNRRDGDSRNRKGTVHPTLILLLIAWFPLIVRGIFGLLQAFDWSMSYYNPENYDAGGFTPRFTAIEYMLGVFTEWTACVLLNCTYFTSKNDPKKRDVLAEKEGKSSSNEGLQEADV